VPLGLRIDKLRFSGSEQPVSVGDSAIVVFIGPNNAGKSRALEEIARYMHSEEGGQVVQTAEIQKDGDQDDLKAWLTTATAPSPHPTINDNRIGQGGQIMMSTARLRWSQTVGIGELVDFLVFRADAETRLQLAQEVPSVDALHGQATQPLQRLLRDHSAERQLADSVERAFGQPICVNRTGGATLHLHLGRPQAEARLDNPEYLEEMRALPLVSAQGDGMRSFIGLLLTLAATDYPLVLIDEPEAFLHPPQAREMGRQLAKPSPQQRFVATHDSDVLLGLLDTTQPVTVVRLRREGEANVPSVLDSARLTALWRDPSFRYSNLLSGLFHRGVVVCEADGDALLYGAALDHALLASGQASSDLLFTQCGGKHKFPTAISALRPMGVPTGAIADIDVLRDESLLSRIVGALEGSWDALRNDWYVVKQAVEQLPGAHPLISDVREQIDGSLGPDPTARLTEDQSRRVREITSRTDGWRIMRERGGLPAIPRGDATQAAERLLAALADLGLFVVPVGALEGWVPAVGGHGSAFVYAALESQAHETSSTLQNFVMRVTRHLHVLA